MASKTQSGFSAVISIIAIVLVVGVLGLIGWRLYSQPSKQNSVTISTSQSPKPPISNPGNSTAVPQSIYLDIKELGIKIKLDDSIKDAIYTIHTNATNGRQFANISTQTLTSKSNGSCSPDNGFIASIGKVSGTPEQVFSGPGIDPVNNSTTFKFGTDTYVYISAPQQIW